MTIITPHVLDTPLLQIANSTTPLTIRQAVEGIQIFGGIGSGKTSGSGATLARKYLEAGFGGLVLTVKRDELEENWRPLCKATGRENDLIVIEPGGKHSFNFIAYELAESQDDQAGVDNLVNIIKTVIQAANNQQQARDEQFWQDSLDILLHHTLDLCLWAYGDELTLDKWINVIHSLPSSAHYQHETDPHKKTPYQKATTLAEHHINKKAELSKESDLGEYAYLKGLLEKNENYFIQVYARLGEKTRSTIEVMLSGLLFRLSRNPVYSLLCSPSANVTPQMCETGKIIVINLPVKLYDKVGRDAQILFKYIWQRAMERRVVKSNTKPVFLWADEAQNFIHAHDIDYQATARSSRICTVYLTQNLPNYYAKMGGKEGEYRVKSFLGTMGTKIFHANADVETNNYASALFGQAYFEDRSSSFTLSNEMSASQSKSYKLEYKVRPEKFVSLKTGGPDNNNLVEAHIHRQGAPFRWVDKSNNERVQNHRKITFKQL